METQKTNRQHICIQKDQEERSLEMELAEDESNRSTREKSKRVQRRNSNKNHRLGKKTTPALEKELPTSPKKDAHLSRS